MIVRRSATMKKRAAFSGKRPGPQHAEIVLIEIYWLFWIIPIYYRERITGTSLK